MRRPFDPTRRRVLAGGLGTLACSFIGARASAEVSAPTRSPLLGFTGIPTTDADTITVADGYEARVFFAWGDPVSDGPAFDVAHGVAEQEKQAGMHHDGMHLFPLSGTGTASQHGLLVMNHEYTDDELLHVGGMDPWTPAKVQKSLAAHGVSVIEVKQENGQWQVVRPSRYARRITASTPTVVSGPAAGSPLLQTEADPTGKSVLGTFANCACGHTPWGTYLACEENIGDYFAGGKPVKPEHARYGILVAGAGWRWHEHEPRFDCVKTPNEANRHGWVTEIDPFDPRSVPVKRTALGRFAHESATVRMAKDGRVVVYMGDDARFEHVYKFVSDGRYDLAAPEKNRDLLDRGTLYAARFNANGSGDWLPLVWGQRNLDPAHGFRTPAQVLVHTRIAATTVGATPMDRPEWIAVHPQTGEVYVSLTNNALRGDPERPGTDAANPRAKNVYGHVIRWREDNDDPTVNSFRWEMFAVGGPVEKGGTARGDVFGSPDGLVFDARGVLWIHTDITTALLNKGEMAPLGNNALYAADPATGEVRRFLVGPRGCEITGAAFTPDGTTLFLNVQHPGESASGRADPRAPKAISSWPDGEAGKVPRSAALVVRRKDGGVIGA